MFFLIVLQTLLFSDINPRSLYSRLVGKELFVKLFGNNFDLQITYLLKLCKYLSDSIITAYNLFIK